MRTRLHLKPGQKGTKQLLTQYGDRLVCVRYRYDAQRKKRFKPVELIIAQRDWDPPTPRVADDALVRLASRARDDGNPRVFCAVAVDRCRRPKSLLPNSTFAVLSRVERRAEIGAQGERRRPCLRWTRSRERLHAPTT